MSICNEFFFYFSFKLWLLLTFLFITSFAECDYTMLWYSFEVHWVYWICGFIVLTEIGKSLTIIFQIYFFYPPITYILIRLFEFVKELTDDATLWSHINRSFFSEISYSRISYIYPHLSPSKYIVFNFIWLVIVITIGGKVFHILQYPTENKSSSVQFLLPFNITEKTNTHNSR